MDGKVLWQIAYGVYAIGVMDTNRPCGCIANSFIQITSQNPIVALSMNKNNFTAELIKRTGRFSVSILTQQTDPIVISSLGFASGKDKDKYQQIGYKSIDNLPVVQDNCSGYLICEVLSIQDAETHLIIQARVVDTVMGVDAPPMTYEYYQKVIKGKAPKNAPTYRKEENSQNPVCDVCGYVYEGSLESMPDDYLCPVCGADKSHFKIKS